MTGYRNSQYVYQRSLIALALAELERREKVLLSRVAA
jgi:hypothetical protein